MSNACVLSIHDANAIQVAKKILEAGGLISFPTDTVYGLAVPISSQTGIDRIFSAKGRDFNKAIAVLIGNFDQLSLLTPDFPSSAQKLSAAFWPGALTLVVKIRPGLPPNLSPYPTIGIRMPDHPFVLSMLRETGPLATTSANLSGYPDAVTVQDVQIQLGEKIELLLDGGRTKGAIPSTVVDCTKEELTIIRKGSITEQDLRKVLG